MGVKASKNMKSKPHRKYRKAMKQPALKENETRNERRNKRKGEALEIVKALRSGVGLKCAVCGVEDPLTFYGRHRNLKVSDIIEGNVSLRMLKRKIERCPIMCLNHAELRRKEPQ